MMKALPLTIALFTAVTTSYATDCQFLNIRITNNTPYTCYLTEYTSLAGSSHIHHADLNNILKNMPLVIRPGAKTERHSFVEGSNPAGLNLRYECGEGRSITIHSTQPKCVAVNGHVHGKVLAAENMSATYTATDSHYGGPQGKIRWILN